MEVFTQETNNLKEIRKRIKNSYGINDWENSLSLPEIKTVHHESELRLEKDLGFVFVRNEESFPEKALVFISERTDFLRLTTVLPFLFSTWRLYQCHDRLIQDRLRFMDQDESFENENQTTKILKSLLEIAAQSNASDLHFESLPDQKQIRMRRNGKLEPIELNETIDESLFLKIKLTAGMDIAQKRLPQDGHFPYTTNQGRRFDLRTATIPGVHGEKIVIRLLPSTVSRFSMEDMKFPINHIHTIKKTVASKTGMILICGPTGSGKTTSLYAILQTLINETMNILTIEDPVEYRIEEITQMEVNEQSGLTFASALRASLRMDPDVILVGEIRDSETASIAARAAQTGHMVLSTIHSNNVFEAIHRLKSLGVQGDDIASSLKLIIAQRLINQYCPCQGKTATCPKCSGHKVLGRIPLMELLPVSYETRRMLSLEEKITTIEKQAQREGFLSLREYGEKLAKQGIISITELDHICS